MAFEHSTAQGRADYWRHYRQHQLPYSVKTCTECGCGFHPRGPQKRCEECMHRVCVNCGQRFRLTQGKRHQECCSRTCAALTDSERIERIKINRGTKPRTYAKSHRDKHGSAEDREWRAAVFARDDYTCQYCGQRGGRLQAHHIKPFKAFPEARHELSNGLTLCIECHKQTDTYGWANYWRTQIAAKRLAQGVLPLEST